MARYALQTWLRRKRLLRALGLAHLSANRRHRGITFLRNVRQDSQNRYTNQQGNHNRDAQIDQLFYDCRYVDIAWFERDCVVERRVAVTVAAFVSLSAHDSR